LSLKRNVKDTSIIDLPYNKAIKILAIPAILTNVCQVLFEFVDAYWLGKLQNSDVFAAVGAASFITWALYALMNIVTSGVNSYVAQYAGASDKIRYHQIAFQGIILSVICSIVITLSILPFYHSIFVIMGLKGFILKATEEYFIVMNYGFVALFLFSTTGIIFNSHGDTKITFWTTAITLFLNIVLAPVMILGLWIIPPMGVYGAALATIVSEVVGVALRLHLLIKKDFLSLKKEAMIFSLSDCLDILKVGIPMAVGNFVFCMVFPVLTKFITMLGNINALSALNICHRVEGIAYFTCIGFFVSASTMVGQYTGVKRMKKAIDAAWYNIFYIVLILLPVSLIFIFYPQPFIYLMTSDENVLREGVEYLRIIGYCEIFLGLEIVFQGIFTGFGTTLYPNLIYIPLTIGRIPLAYYLAFTCHFGVEGIWWSITITTFFKGILVALLFLCVISGKYRQKETAILLRA